MPPRERRTSAARPARTVSVNRAPVLALWAAVVAERLGHDRAEALTLGRALAGLNAQTKGRRLGIFSDAGRGRPRAPRTRAPAGGVVAVPLLGREVPARRTPEGLRALERDRVASPESAERYLEARFGDSLAAVRAAFEALARAFPRDQLAERGFALYEAFRPTVPAGQRGWGARGVLDLDVVAGLARRPRS